MGCGHAGGGGECDRGGVSGDRAAARGVGGRRCDAGVARDAGVAAMPGLPMGRWVSHGCGGCRLRRWQDWPACFANAANPKRVAVWVTLVGRSRAWMRRCRGPRGSRSVMSAMTRMVYPGGRGAYSNYIAKALDVMGISDPVARANWTRGLETGLGRESGF